MSIFGIEMMKENLAIKRIKKVWNASQKRYAMRYVPSSKGVYEANGKNKFSV